MEAPRYKSGHIIFFRGNDWDKNLSPEELQRVTGQFMAWFERLTREGKAIGGAPLENEGKIVAEQIAAQGRPVDMGGYYHPNEEKTAKAMRPSETLNALIG